ncbi:tetratricopeptide repeat protein [Paenibacillus hexagrammi]|uniref:Tetratricopeptide repeat protein n=1 Tax=Paenibacillus hexagrammi TaxID=2908839 RepID=A0ABY3SS78_9BACL|nr:tetratricopeptide repeat protein [Paenibacillus sp. YPD9-1]UJF35866.1 tetratricopeptide repeat protein [Paenibacillus sp. YPD9-1]
MIRPGQRFRNHLDDHLVHLHKNLYISPSDPMYYDKVIRYVDPNSPEAHYKLGQRYQASGNRKRAIFHYKQVLKTYPSPFYSAANRAIYELENSHTALMETAAAAEAGHARKPILPPFMKTLLIVLFIVNLMLLTLFFGDKAIGTTVSRLMKWGTGSSVTYETVDVPYIMYISPDTAKSDLESTLHKKALELSDDLPDQNIMIYGLAATSRGDIGKTVLLTNDEMMKSAFVIAEYHPATDSTVKIRFLNPQYSQHQPQSALGANFVRTALESYRSDHGYLPSSLEELFQSYPDNYISFIPLEAVSGSADISPIYDGTGGGFTILPQRC